MRSYIANQFQNLLFLAIFAIITGFSTVAYARQPASEVQKQADRAIQTIQTAAQQSQTASQHSADAARDAATSTSDAKDAAASSKDSANTAKDLIQQAAQKQKQAEQLQQQADTAIQAAKKATDQLELGPTPAVGYNDNVGPKDYVPCLFDRQTLLAMRGYADTKTELTQAQANELLKVIIKASAASGVKEDLIDTFDSAEQSYLDDYFSTHTTLPLADFKTSIKIIAKTTKVTVKSKYRAQTAEIQAAVVQSADTQAAVVQSVVDNVIPTGQYQRPRDIACSMSIFPWDISHMVFGRTVADHYLAVQVIVRNLDPNHEYLIHDAELAVDAYSGQLERFQASHEKEAVRGVTIYGQNYDRHAVLSHVVEGIGMIAGAIVGLPAPSISQLTDASGAYAAGFVPTFQKLFPDLTTNNLNNLNDLGFSAASASRIVVPKAGAVPFVIFVPVQPLEQACWLQPGYAALDDVQPNSACDAIRTVQGKPRPD